MHHIKRYFSFPPYLSFLPFLAIYAIIIYFRHDDAIMGDEGRYYMFAQHLLKGFYSPPPPNINLWNGPGYPIFLMPFVAFRLPLIYITLCNSLFHYFSIILIFKALKKYISFNKTILFSLFWACYYIALVEIHLILTESFTIFLISGILYWISQTFSKDLLNNNAIIGLGITIGYLALTKIIFGYVILVLLSSWA